MKRLVIRINAADDAMLDELLKKSPARNRSELVRYHLWHAHFKQAGLGKLQPIFWRDNRRTGRPKTKL